MFANLTQLAGIAVLVYGLALIWVPLAVVAAGAAVFLLGVGLEGGSRKDPRGGE